MAYDWFLIAQERGFATPKQFLTQKYTEDGWTMQEIADEVGCSTWVVRYALDRWEIKRRPHGGTRHSKSRLDPNIVSSVIDKLEKEKP
jgi:hypothetical protein